MKKFSELRNKALVDEARRARVEAYKAELLAELSLAELRQARRVTQGEVAVALSTTQSGISRLEHQTDLYISTLKKYIEAVGGKLHIVAEFADVRVPITTFAELVEQAPRRLLPAVRLPVSRGPLPALGQRQAALPLAAATGAPEDSYFIYQPIQSGELLARLFRKVRTDSLVLEWVRVAPSLEGASVHVSAETTTGKTLEVDVYPVASGLESVIAEKERIGPAQVSSVTLEFTEAL